MRTYLFVVASFIGGVALITQGAIQRLDAATAHQCITRDWPADAHAVHMEWCEDNNYPTY